LADLLSCSKAACLICFTFDCDAVKSSSYACQYRLPPIPNLPPNAPGFIKFDGETWVMEVPAVARSLGVTFTGSCAVIDAPRRTLKGLSLLFR
jgi:hypothetical protein